MPLDTEIGPTELPEYPLGILNEVVIVVELTTIPVTLKPPVVGVMRSVTWFKFIDIIKRPLHLDNQRKS